MYTVASRTTVMRYLDLRAFKKMVSILCRAILYTGIIDHQAGKCFPAVIHPEAGCVLHWMIPEWVHMFYQFLVCDDASLFEAIHTLLDAHNSRKTLFSLVVDDFCVQYISTEDADHFLNSLRSKYLITVDMEATV